MFLSKPRVQGLGVQPVRQMHNLAGTLRWPTMRIGHSKVAPHCCGLCPCKDQENMAQHVCHAAAAGVPTPRMPERAACVCVYKVALRWLPLCCCNWQYLSGLSDLLAPAYAGHSQLL